VFEIFVFPDMGLERGVGYVARIGDDVVTEGFEVGLAKIAAGGLQGLEKQAGGLCSICLPGAVRRFSRFAGKLSPKN
jgi:hypothetical protein